MTLDTVCKHHPGAQIDVYVQAGTPARIHPSVVEAMRKVGCSVVEQRFDPLTFFEGTPFEAFAAANMTKLLDGPYRKTMITDLVRMAALWKNGGWYLDTDVVVLRPLTNLRNVAGLQNLQDGGQVNGAVLHLEKGSPFLLHVASHLPGCRVAAFRQTPLGHRRLSGTRLSSCVDRVQADQVPELGECISVACGVKMLPWMNGSEPYC